MNFLRRIVARKKGLYNEESSALQQERSLCIQHLRKLFLEFLHPPAPLPQDQQDLKIYLMLPLFLKAFNETDPGDISEKFSDTLQFAGHTSTLLVTEVQRRAANKSKLDASKDVIEYLRCHDSEADNRGWNLLLVLSILTESDESVIRCMLAPGLQSILVKCMRLFFSLPEHFIEEPVLLQIKTVLTATLVKLCNHTETALQLIRTDELASLFESLTQSVSNRHVIWRNSISEVVTAITRHCFTSEVIQYIHQKSCISLSLANIQQAGMDDPLAVVEMFVTLMCVLKDSADVSPVLLDGFRDCHGYKFLHGTLLGFSTKASVDDDSKEACRNLVILISSLVMTGHVQLLPSSTISTPFQTKDQAHQLEAQCATWRRSRYFLMSSSKHWTWTCPSRSSL